MLKLEPVVMIRSVAEMSGSRVPKDRWKWMPRILLEESIFNVESMLNILKGQFC